MTPTVQPQPNEFEYSESYLELLPRVDRTSKAPDGSDWPPGDPSWPIQAWYDDNPVQDPALPPDHASYWIYNGNSGAPGLVKTPVPFARAKVPNLPGGVLQPYVPAPTPATTGASGSSALNPNLLSTTAQAIMLSRLVTGGVVIVEQFPPVQYNGETRRVWVILTPYRDPLTKQQPVNYVGLLLQQSAGPGHWDATALAMGRYLWVAANPGPLPPSAPTLDVPCRQLLPNEYWYVSAGPLGIPQEKIRRNDIPDPNPTPGGGSYTAADRQRDVDTHNMVATLLSKFG